VLEEAMTLPTLEEARSWRGLMLVAAGDEPVGRIDAVYLDRTTRKPEWVLVNTGLFGSARTFVPLADASKLGDTVRVPHDPRVIREAPRLERDVDLSESDEARLYAHYGIDYTTSVSPSGLPAAESGTDATDQLPQAAGTAPSTATRRLEADEAAWSGRLDESERLWLESSRARSKRRPLLAGLAALALAAIGSGVAMLRARRQRPKTFSERLAKAGRDAADTLSSTASAIAREAAAVGTSDRARRATAGGRRAAQRAAAGAAAGGAAAAAGGRWAARRAGGAGRQAATEGRRFARRAGKQAAEAAAGTKTTAATAGTKAATGGRRFARRAGKQAAEAAAGTKTTAATAGTKAAEAATETKAAVAAKRASRRRTRARKRATAAAADTARSLTAFPTAAGRRMQRLNLDERGRKAREQARKAAPRRRRRSKMKVMGKLGMALGAAVGYVLGAKAGRERYEQITASARQFMDKPQVKRVMESAPGNLGARVEQVANKAADAVHQAGDKVAPSGTGAGTGTSTEAAPATSTPSTTAGPTPAPSASGGAETGTSGGATTTRRSGGGSSSKERSKND
jgi:hypothetical protein